MSFITDEIFDFSRVHPIALAETRVRYRDSVLVAAFPIGAGWYIWPRSLSLQLIRFVETALVTGERSMPGLPRVFVGIYQGKMSSAAGTPLAYVGLDVPGVVTMNPNIPLKLSTAGTYSVFLVNNCQHYAIDATVCGCLRGMSSVADVVSTALPLAPSNLYASSVTSLSITVTWTDNSDNEDGFIIQRSTDGVTWSQVATVGPNITSYIDTGLSPLETYYYRVSAYNNIGQSDFSPSISATTGANNPPTVSAGSSQSGALTVSLTGSVTDPDGNPLTFTWSLVSGPGNVTSWTPAATGSGVSVLSANVTAIVSVAGSYTFQLVGSDGYASDSEPTTISVSPAPTITTQPAGGSISSGNTFTMSVVAAGTAPLTYQWYEGLSGVTTTPIGGATSSSYTTPTLTSAKNYWVRVTNVGGSTDSNTAAVTISS